MNRTNQKRAFIALQNFKTQKHYFFDITIGRKTRMSFGEIRKYASDLLRGNWLIMMVGYVLCLVTWTIVTQIIGTTIGTQIIFSIFEPFLEGWTGFKIHYLIFPVLVLLLFILADLLHISYRWFGLELVDYKKERVKVNHIFQVFRRSQFMKVLSLVIVRSLIILLWSLLFLFPGIWKAYNYSQAPNILKDNPEISIAEALKQSEKLMQNKWWTYILIQLSFALWYIIPIVLYALFIFNNLDEIAVGIDMGQEGIELIFGMLFGVFFILGLLLIFFSLFVEPRKMISKQIFYRELTSPPRNEKDYDDFEQKLLKKQGLLKRER